MNMLKKGLLLLTAFVFMFAFTSCGCSNQEAEKQYKDGSVIYCEAGELLMVTAASEVLSFDVENANIDAVDSIEYGDLAEVEYTGEITDGDTSEVTVSNVTVVPGDIFEEEADKATNSAKKEKAKKEEKAAAEATIAAVSDVVYVTANDVAVRSGYDVKADRIGTVNKGKKLTRTGKVSNGWSRIKYDGKDAYVSGKYLTTKKPAKKSDKKKKKEKKKKKDKKKGKVVMDATVKSIENNQLTLDTEAGNEYTFDITGLSYDVVLDPGTPVTVTFEGTEDQPGKILKLEAR